MRSLLLAVLLSSVALAQSERGNIAGVVTDTAGAAMPNVAVSIINSETNTSTRVTTTSTGEFNAPNLQSGDYKIEVSAPGFKRFVGSGIRVTAGSTIREDVQLQIGQLTESIEVRADRVQLNTEDAKVTAAVDNKLIDELPLLITSTCMSGIVAFSSATLSFPNLNRDRLCRSRSHVSHRASAVKTVCTTYWTHQRCFE